MMSFNAELKERQDYINRVLDAYLPAVEGRQKTVLSAMRYSVTIGGKRLRPMMMAEVYRSFAPEGDLSKAEPFMAAMEMLHTYSLVHDDLPDMDNDMYRRGQLTTHAKYGADMAILAGDALLNYSFETACKAFSDGSNPAWDIRVAKALKIFGNKAGIFGMIGGQVVDVESAGNAVSKEVLDFIYELKTSALIESSMMIGAILAGACEEAIKDIETIAKNVGIAFQIQDDILDVTSTAEVLGKPILSDEKNEKTTYVTLVGLEKAKEYVENISLEAIELLHHFETNDLFLEELLKSLIHREK